MASSIDETKPIEGSATTQSVRDNFSAAKTEIEALQTFDLDLASSTNNTKGHSVIAATSDLVADIATISTNEITITIASTLTIASNVTIPANVELIFTRTGELSINAGVTVTCNGNIKAGRWQIFSGSGSVAFTKNTTLVEELYPEWWGAVYDGSTENATALQACLTAAEDGKLPVSLHNGEYDFSTTLVTLDRITIRGQNKEDTKLVWTGGASIGVHVKALFAGGDDSEECYLGRFSIINEGTGTIGLQVDPSYTTLDHVRVYAASGGNDFSTANIRTDTAVNVNQLNLLNCEVRSDALSGGSVGALISRGANINIMGGYYGGFDTNIQLGDGTNFVTNCDLYGGAIIETFPGLAAGAVGLEVKSGASLKIGPARFEHTTAGHRAIKVTGPWRGGSITSNSFAGQGVMTAAIEFATTTENAQGIQINGNYFQSIASYPITLSGGHTPDFDVGSNHLRSTGNLRIVNPTLTDGDTTPSVGHGNFFITANTGATTITGFDGVARENEKEIFFYIGDNNTSFDFTGTNLKGNKGSDWTTAATGDWLRAKHYDQIWYCEIYDNT